MSDRVLLTAATAQRRWLIVAIATAALSATAALLLPTVLGWALDAALRQHHLTTAIIRLAVVLAAIAIADVVGQLAGTAGAAGTTAWLRRRMVRSLLDLGLPGQRRYPPGEATSRITSGATAAGRVLPLALSVVTTLLGTIAALIVLGLIDWTLPVTLLVGLPVTVLVLRPFAREATEAYTDYQNAQGELADRFAEGLAGLRTIRASGTVAAEVERVLVPLSRLRAAGVRTWALNKRIAWAFGLLVAVLQVAILAMAGWLVSQGRITPGELVAAVGYATIVLGAIEQVDTAAELTQARAGAARVAELVTPPTPARPPGEFGDGPGAVEFRAVTVLADDRVVLDRCSLSVPGGATMAVVGPSGAGKSTLVALLGRLVEPASGDVLIDGYSVSTLDSAQLRSAVAYAFERPVLVGATVAEAIGYAANSSIEVAAVAAHADGFVRRLPRGYRTAIADAPLSGGEQQRLGLARAVAQQARVLVLDDATSSLDTATEADVSAALATVLPGHTRLVVAHRAATAAAADTVAWLADGRIQAVGPHAELWADPRYRALWS